MKNFRKIVIIIIIAICSFTNNGFSQPPTTTIGCQASDGWVYFQYLSYLDGLQYVFMGYSPYTIDGSPSRYLWNTSAMNNFSCYRYITVGYDAPISCKIKTSSSSNTFIEGTRGRFLYNITYCPIDNYTHLLIAICGVLGFITIRKKLFFEI